MGWLYKHKYSSFQLPNCNTEHQIRKSQAKEEEYVSLFMNHLIIVVTKTGDDHRPPQTIKYHQQTTTKYEQTTKQPENDHKPPANNHIPPANNHKPPETTKNHHNRSQTTNKRV